jgi:hypothetical protein
MHFGFEHRRCVMFVACRTKNRKLHRSVMLPRWQETCRSHGAKKTGAGSCYKYDAPTALNRRAVQPQV